MIWPSHPAAIICDTHEKKTRKNNKVGHMWKDTNANLWQNDLAKPSSASKHLRDRWKDLKETFGNMILPSHPAKQSSGIHRKRIESKHLAKWPGQATQKSTHLGSKRKDMTASLWPHDLAKPSSNAMMWETNEKKRKLTFDKKLWPNHPAKESSGTNMKTHASKHVS